MTAFYVVSYRTNRIRHRKESKMEFNQEFLLTPEGVRDIYGEECEKRVTVQENIHSIMKSYGFKDIQTPGYEFFDIFSQKRGTASAGEMFKFFDRNNNTLVLRPDITPSIARCFAKYYKEETLPVRFCYTGNTYKNNTSYQGRLKETCQLGAELINDPSSDADGEMIALTIQCLQKAGLEQFQLNIGHAGIFSGLAEEAALGHDEEKKLREYLENKNIFGAEEFLTEKKISGELKDIFIHLPEYLGGPELLDQLKSKVQNEELLSAIERLKNVYAILEIYGLSDYATLDLGLLNHYHYYTGIVFKVYTYGTGEAVATGGRYDSLICQFGKQAPAVGVVILLDRLMTVLFRQDITLPAAGKDTLILYRSANREMAIRLGNRYRGDGLVVRLMRKDGAYGIERYQEYAKSSGAGGILYIEDEETVRIIDIAAGTESTKNIGEMILAEGGTH